jgi:hypothetical protein
MMPDTGAAPVPVQLKAEEIMTLEQTKLIELLTSDAPDFARAKACQRLAVIGTREAVPALAALLADPKFSHYARYGLEPIPDPSVDDALREASGKLTGRLQIGVINSLGNRRDTKAVEALARLMDGSDADVAAAAAAALGRIGDGSAAKELQRVLDRTKTVAGACLECCEGLLTKGNKEQALALYEALLLRSDVPPAVRLAATRGQQATRRP